MKEYGGIFLLDSAAIILADILFAGLTEEGGCGALYSYLQSLCLFSRICCLILANLMYE
jgi:hypothetical protein